MADVDRHVPWRRSLVTDWMAQQWPIFAEVRGSTVIDKGDLLFMDRVDGLRNNGTSTLTNSVYPLSNIGGTTKALASNQQLAADNFLGVAMYDSDSGVTETISAATGGLFKFPLKSPKTVKIGDVVMPAGSGTSLYSQKVIIWTSGTTYDLGMVMKARARATNIEFRVRPSVMGLGNAVI